MSVKDICFSNYSISVFMVFYNLFSHEKDRSKAVSHSENCVFLFHDFWMGTATAVFRRNMPCKNRIGKAFLLRRISVFDEDALKELSFFMCKDL